MPRVARKVYIGYPHHIVQRGNNKQRVFKDYKDRLFYLCQLRKYSWECDCKVHAYCLMPNHIHLLLVPSQQESLAKIMQKLNLSYTQYINRKYNRSGRLWESRFFSSQIDKESYLWSVCRYIEQNPLRAGITSKVIEYRWSSAKINCGLLESGFVEPIWKNYLDSNEYRLVLTEPLSRSRLIALRTLSSDFRKRKNRQKSY